MSGRIVVLTGGVGGAKLVDGLYRLLPPDSLIAIVNTGDDFEHLGLSISPDIDTLLYTLSGKANDVLGWGRKDETWSFMAALQSLGGPAWFNLGDGDLALHIMRSAALAAGERLSSVIQRFARAWDLSLRIYPMSDSPVRTWVDSEEGALPFQRYFVERKCAPAVRSIRFEGAAQSAPPQAALTAIAEADAILIAPSNPWLSIDPILAVPPLAEALAGRNAPLVVVSPLVRGAAVKGPTAKLMNELGIAVSNASIAEHYGDLLDGMVLHEGDDAPVGLPVIQTDTLMRSPEDRLRVAEASLDLVKRIRGDL